MHDISLKISFDYESLFEAKISVSVLNFYLISHEHFNLSAKLLHLIKNEQMQILCGCKCTTQEDLTMRFMVQNYFV